MLRCDVVLVYFVSVWLLSCCVWHFAPYLGPVVREPGFVKETRSEFFFKKHTNRVCGNYGSLLSGVAASHSTMAAERVTPWSDETFWRNKSRLAGLWQRRAPGSPPGRRRGTGPHPGPSSWRPSAQTGTTGTPQSEWEGLGCHTPAPAIEPQWAGPTTTAWQVTSGGKGHHQRWKEHP